MYYFGKQKLTDTLFTESVGSVIAVDIETVSLIDRTMLGVGIATSPDDAFYFTTPEIDAALPVLKDPDITKVYHNCMFDIYGLYDYDVDMTNMDDTAVLARLLGLPGALKGLCFNLAVKNLIPHITVFGMKEVLDEFGTKTCDLMPERYVAEKCALDVKATFHAHRSLMQLVDGHCREAHDVDMQVAPILTGMSKRGISIDPARLSYLIGEHERERDRYLKLCNELGLQNPNSVPQVQKALMDRGVLFPKKERGKWKVKTNKDTLKSIPDVLAQAIIAFRHEAHNLSTYLYPLLDQERSYTHFHMDAATSRMSSFEPNLNNVPGEKNGGSQMRSMYIPDSGWFTCADASQMQLRILAHLSQDPVMLRVFDNNGDIHQETADYFGRPRDNIVKNVNFGVVFGATYQTVMEKTGADRATAEMMLKGWFKKYKRAGDWIHEMQEQGVRDGYVYTDYGRKLYIPVDGGRAHAHRCCVNYPIQGTEAEAIKRWMLRCVEATHIPVLVVHDELIFDEWADDLPTMEGITNYRQPIGVCHKDRWS